MTENTWTDYREKLLEMIDEGLCRLVSRSSSEIEIYENEIMKLEGGE